MFGMTFAEKSGKEKLHRMKKTQLKKMKSLPATPNMIKLAKAQILERSEYGSHMVFPYGAFLRCRKENGILKIALFTTRDLRMGSRTPLYEVFADRESRSFITWDTALQKWRDAKADILDWPREFWGTKRYIEEKDNRLLKKYLGVRDDGYMGLLEFQRAVRKEQLLLRHKKETDAWDAYLAQIPELPNDWENWVDKYGMEQQYIFYDYSRKKKKTGFCGWCGKEVPIKEPKHNQEASCLCCGHKIQFKCRGRAGRICTDRETVYLFQDYSDGMVLRQFSVRRFYQAGNYEAPEISAFEMRRVFYQNDKVARTFYYGLYKQRYHRWIESANTGSDFMPYYGWSADGHVYGAALPGTKCKGLMRTGIPEYLHIAAKFDPEIYMARLGKRPYMERVVKAGLYQLAEDLYKGKAELNIVPSSDFAKSLGIDRNLMKRLREHNGGIKYLNWLVLEKRQGKEITDSLIQYFAEQGIEAKDLEFITDQMNVVRIKNYLKRQRHASGRKQKELLSTWKDYLAMSERIGRDIKKEIIYKPKDLLKAHDEAMKLCEDLDMENQAEELAKQYPDVNAICQAVKKKYEYGDDQYQIIMPNGIKDIMLDARALRHCVRYTETYYDRIQRQESYIAFLRRTDCPEKAFYTLEIEPDGTARQKRTVGDKQDVDFEAAVGFIRKWQREVQKRLTPEDRQLAKISAVLRVEEFKELRKKDTRIWHGHLQGKPLADVLEADLLEAVRCIEEELPAAA